MFCSQSASEELQKSRQSAAETQAAQLTAALGTVLEIQAEQEILHSELKRLTNENGLVSLIFLFSVFSFFFKQQTNLLFCFSF